MQLVGAFLLLTFSTMGFASLTCRFLKNQSESIRLWLFAPLGFFALFTLIVVLRLSEGITGVPLAQITLALSAAIGFVQMLKIGTSRIWRYFKCTWFVFMPYLAFGVISNLVRGGLPFSVTDAWTHTSYINRISDSNSALIVGSHLPTDGKFFSFSSTSIFLSTVNDLIGRDPIATWNASCIIFGLLLLSAATAFLISLNLIPLMSNIAMSAVSALFIVLYPTADLVTGWAGYSMTGSIFLFTVLTLTIQCAVDTNQKILTCCLLLVGFVMSMNHQVESILGLLMMVPLIVLPQISKKHLIGIIVYFGLVSAVGGIVATRLLNPGILVVFDFAVSWPGLNYLLTSISPFLNLRLLIALFFSCLYLWVTGRRRVVTFCSVCLLTIFLVGPWNPLFFQLWVNLMSATLMYRIIFALPIWIPLGLFVAGFIEDLRSFQVRRLSNMAICIVIAVALGQHAAAKFGFTGEMTYYGTDKQSQLRTLPDLYRKIQSYKGKIILTDTWTGAPIPTISSNFLVVHRPWSSGPDVDRWAIGRETMNSLATTVSQSNMCQWGVDLVLMNKAELPLMRRQFLAAPWLLPDFYTAPFTSLPKQFQEVEVIDDVQILEFDRANCVD